MTAGFERHERALVDEEAATLDALFLDSPLTLRHGATGNLDGHAAWVMRS